MFPKKPRNRSAFSLIEISVVVIVVSILIAGVVSADSLVSKSRITAAQNLSRSAPINYVPGAALWLESSLETSFNSGEASNGSALSTWYDQRNSVNKVTVSTAGSSPTYSNTINRIHAVEFDGTANKYFTFDGSFLNNTDYTIFVLEKRKSAAANNYFLGAVGSGANNSLALGYSADSTIIHAQGSNSYSSGISNYASSKDNPRVFAFTSDSTGKNTYINGVLAATSSNTAQLSGITTLSIGQGYVGEIGEIAIFTRALKPEERVPVEDYLGKKWTSKINRASAPSCVGGTVTLSGCDSSGSSGGGSGGSTPTTCPVSVTGVSSTTPVAVGSGTLTCDVTGYTGTSTYTCSSGGSLSATACAVAIAPCTGGTIDTSSVAGATIHKFTTSGTFSCPTARNVQVLVVAGGGGGAGGAAGGGGAGGGAGGVIYNSSFAVSTSPISVTVGAGGNGGPGNIMSLAASGLNGSNSIFSTLTAIGGGGGGAREDSSTPGGSGGSGGGAGVSATHKAGGAGTSGQGNNGGANAGVGPHYGAGGGGGAGGVGQDGSGSKGGDGGIGVLCTIANTNGDYYGGGGGSSFYNPGGTYGIGGLGGGGAVGVAGTDYLGGGGGGGAVQSSSGANGGSGVVIVRY